MNERSTRQKAFVMRTGRNRRSWRFLPRRSSQPPRSASEGSNRVAETPINALVFRSHSGLTHYRQETCVGRLSHCWRQLTPIVLERHYEVLSPLVLPERS